MLSPPHRRLLAPGLVPLYGLSPARWESWEQGWAVLFETLEALTDRDLACIVTIRGEPHTVVKAMQRQVSHYAYHVGQIVLLARHAAGDSWRTLSMPKAPPAG